MFISIFVIFAFIISIFVILVFDIISFLQSSLAPKILGESGTGREDKVLYAGTDDIWEALA